MTTFLPADAASTSLSMAALAVDLLLESSLNCAKVLDLNGKFLSMNENRQWLKGIDDLLLQGTA